MHAQDCSLATLQTRSSHRRGVPTVAFAEKRLPSTNSRSFGGSPPAGRTDRTLEVDTTSPAFTSWVTYSDRRRVNETLSLSVGRTIGLPSAIAAHSHSTARLSSSCGSIENPASTPPSRLERVTCFSIIVAPRAVAATLTPIPKVWSDSPTASPKASRNVEMRRRFASSAVAG